MTPSNFKVNGTIAVETFDILQDSVLVEYIIPFNINYLSVRRIPDDFTHNIFNERRTLVQYAVLLLLSA